ncbi:mitochondrial potassium channel isoform X2 [Thalassophryne amazonica]|uniref:mitochondrial potassium channel isoform X2 n=1 Tax=Thalassophryne amazonica TaxID=390379 RepID=UPI001471F3E2|nr:mitochondrial potassium channel isoform X2 [Thalassophryne amazonica]
MRFHWAQVCLWGHGLCCLPRLSLRGSLPARVTVGRAYSTQHPPPANPAPPEEKGKAEAVKERVLGVLQHIGDLSQQWGQRSAKTATATVNYWWGHYEEFVGLNEVREAQTKVTEAEAAFMVARGMVREAHGSLEVLQTRLKEVRDRLDRVSRDEVHYLELATQEHKLLQEDRRLRSAYESAEGSEREKFSLLSAAVRESHEKERTRAERTKNWSIIGSVLGALIGVMGSTYINRVRLQELKNLLLEAQKGPESLQEALRVQAGNHRSQQEELRTLIDSFRAVLNNATGLKGSALQVESGPSPDPQQVPVSALKELRVGGQRAEALLEALPPRLGILERGIGKLQGELVAVRELLETKRKAGQPERARIETRVPGDMDTVQRGLEETQRTLAERIKRNTLYNAALASTATIVTVSALYLLLRGPA